MLNDLREAHKWCTEAKRSHVASKIGHCTAVDLAPRTSLHRGVGRSYAWKTIRADPRMSSPLRVFCKGLYTRTRASVLPSGNSGV